MIVVCAATRTEAAECRRGISRAGVEGFEVLVTGVGPRRAGEALARHLDRVGHGRSRGAAPGRAARLVVSSGFAGALTPDLEPLSWITASALHRLTEDGAVPVTIAPGGLRVVAGAIACQVVTAERAVNTPMSGVRAPAALDMESAALAEVAAAAGVAFSVLRLVTDTPVRPLAMVGRSLAAMLSSDTLSDRAIHGVDAAVKAVRSPRATASFLRETSRWRQQLRSGWRDRARDVLAAATAAGSRPC